MAFQVICESCGVYGHEEPMGPGDVMVRKNPVTHKYMCFDCYVKENERGK